MALDIITIGGLLVEIMHREVDRPFTEVADFVGPYPSGDVGIFIDVAARMGNRCGVIGTVGEDDFGRCLLSRLNADGVDTSLIGIWKGATTGTAFVSYAGDGSRRFIYHWRFAAAGMINRDSIRPELLKDVKWAHVTGVNISVNDQCKEAVYALLKRLPPETKVSFDPNIRPEVLNAAQIRSLCAPALERSDVFFPSKGEAKMFTGAASDDEGCRQLARRGKLVVLKNGVCGCNIYSRDQVINVPAFEVEELDPTGAGDSFCAGFITGLNGGQDLYHAGEFANAVGAIAVTKKGPMEGAKNKQEVLDFIDSHRRAEI